MPVSSDGRAGVVGLGEGPGWRRPRSRAGAVPMRCCAGPCFTSVVECWRFPGAAMVPRDLQDVHPCNLPLQPQKAHQATQNGTWRHSGTLRGTRWTPGHSEKKSLEPATRSPNRSFFLVRMPSIPRQPFPPVAGSLRKDAAGRQRTAPNSYVQLLATSQYYLALSTTSYFTKQPTQILFPQPHSCCIPDAIPECIEHDCNRWLREAAWPGCG